MSEITVKKVHQKLRSLGAKRNNWWVYLAACEFFINVTPHSRCSSFELTYGVKPRLSTADDETQTKAIPRFDESERITFDNIMKRVNNVRNQVKLMRKSAADQYKAYFDRSRHTVIPDYRPGQLVYLKMSNVRPNKFETRFHDELFEVTKVINSDQYGQLVQLTNVTTKRQIDSLIHPNRIRLAFDYTRINGEITKCNTYEKMVEVTGGKHPAVEFVNLKADADESKDKTAVADDLNRKKSPQQSSASDKIQETTELGTQTSGLGSIAPATTAMAAEDRPASPTSRKFFGKQRPRRRPQH